MKEIRLTWEDNFHAKTKEAAAKMGITLKKLINDAVAKDTTEILSKQEEK